MARLGQVLTNTSTAPVILGGTEFVALPNFQPGSLDYRNTCFIAAVVNLRTVLPQIATVLALDSSSWKEVIHHARQLFNGKYEYSAVHNGQHDAAEFLGDVLHQNCRNTQLHTCRHSIANSCGHEWSTTQSHMMFVLALPPIVENSRTALPIYTVKELIEASQRDIPLCDLECDVCHQREQQGTAKHTLVQPLPPVMVMRVNRFTRSGKRFNRVRAEPELKLLGCSYDLQAMVEHHGVSINSGHYVTYLKAGARWELRNDGRRSYLSSPTDSENAYVIVYVRRSSTSAQMERDSSQGDAGSACSIASARRVDAHARLIVQPRATRKADSQQVDSDSDKVLKRSDHISTSTAPASNAAPGPDHVLEGLLGEAKEDAVDDLPDVSDCPSESEQSDVDDVFEMCERPDSALPDAYRRSAQMSLFSATRELATICPPGHRRVGVLYHPRIQLQRRWRRGRVYPPPPQRRNRTSATAGGGGRTHPALGRSPLPPPAVLQQRREFIKGAATSRAWGHGNDVSTQSHTTSGTRQQRKSLH